MQSRAWTNIGLVGVFLVGLGQAACQPAPALAPVIAPTAAAPMPISTPIVLAPTSLPSPTETPPPAPTETPLPTDPKAEAVKAMSFADLLKEAVKPGNESLLADWAKAHGGTVEADGKVSMPAFNKKGARTTYLEIRNGRVISVVETEGMSIAVDSSIYYGEQTGVPLIDVTRPYYNSYCINLYSRPFISQND